MVKLYSVTARFLSCCFHILSWKVNALCVHDTGEKFTSIKILILK